MGANISYHPPQNWRCLYEAAILELDPGKLVERITEAEGAIRNRMEDLNHSSGTSENHALMSALNALRDLREITERDRKSRE